MYDSIIYDLDGTLWNAASITRMSWNEVLKEFLLNKVLSDEDIQSVTGKPQEECVDSLLPGLLAKHPDLMENLTINEEKAIRKHGGVLYDGVREGISELSGKYDLFIVSNCLDWYLKLFLKFSGLEEYFKGHDCFGASRVEKYVMLKRMIGKYDLKKPV